MDINQVGTVTDTVTDALQATREMAGLHLCLKNLNQSIEHLNKAGVFNKAVAADRVLSDARDFMAQSAFIAHKASDELARLNLKIEKINENLKRINAVMGFVHGE